jgi:microcystin degradation protein MlrC
MARIAVGGFQHETNTFAPSLATYEEFVRGGGWPALSRGAELHGAVKGMNLPVAGFIEEATRRGHETVPLAWAACSPSSFVTTDAFERIAGMILEDLEKALPVDAVYLCLHGAMVTEGHEDGEGELLERVRKVVGPSIPVAVSLDLHANTTQKMIDNSDVMIAYRTYPHVDMADTGIAVAKHLDGLLKGSGATYKAFRQVPFIIPINFQCTYMEPAKTVYKMVEDLETGEVASVSFTPGFPAADIWDCGPAVMAYGTSQTAVDRAVDLIAGEVIRREGDWADQFYDPAGAVAYAMRKGNEATRPMVIADTQDNPGTGGDGDTTGFLHALVAQNAQDAALALMCDPGAAEAAHKAGVGAEITISLGNLSKVKGDTPFRGTFLVEALSDGNVLATGPMYGGARMKLGPMACLKIGGVRVAVSSRKVQAADQSLFRAVGIEPTQQKILVLKSSVHFRADFQPIAEEVIVGIAPGPFVADTRALPWKKLRPGLKVSPNGPVYQPGWQPQVS